MSSSLSKARKRENRRRWKQADRAREAELRRPRCMGLVAAAEMAVEEGDADRERSERPRQVAKRTIARQTPMERYLARGEITRQQFDDAERLWADYMRSGLTAAVIGAYEAGSGGGGNLTPGCGPRYAQYQAAMRAVGIILSPVLSFVISGEGSAGDWAKGNKRPREVGMALLVEALDALGRHYRGERGITVASNPRSVV